MPKKLINIKELDHPEQYDDLIREFQAEDRQYPTALEAMLYEVAGHSCTICHAPWMELHHIKELSDGGLTEYGNLIVLCPNCHTRVHRDKTPTPQELNHYKLKQEIAYELPVFGYLGGSDKYVLKFYAECEDKDLPVKELVHHFDTADGDQEAARRECRQKFVGYLQEVGIVHLDIVNVSISPAMTHRVNFRVRLAPKGIKWVRYLRDTKKIGQII